MRAVSGGSLASDCSYHKADLQAEMFTLASHLGCLLGPQLDVDAPKGGFHDDLHMFKLLLRKNTPHEEYVVLECLLSKGRAESIEG